MSCRGARARPRRPRTARRWPPSCGSASRRCARRQLFSGPAPCRKRMSRCHSTTSHSRYGRGWSTCAGMPSSGACTMQRTLASGASSSSAGRSSWSCRTRTSGRSTWKASWTATPRRWQTSATSAPSDSARRRPIRVARTTWVRARGQAGLWRRTPACLRTSGAPASTSGCPPTPPPPPRGPPPHPEPVAEGPRRGPSLPRKSSSRRRHRLRRPPGIQRRREWGRPGGRRRRTPPLVAVPVAARESGARRAWPQEDLHFRPRLPSPGAATPGPAAAPPR
mmetsp:Transcript_2585/g.7694  ORF Transcript_2585/g.7694 Transcript_2585/m.7694 type:complete len:279 (+) Transcript_2585:587-1423(+)